MKKLLIYLKGYEKETILAPLFKMLEALFELSYLWLWQPSLIQVSAEATEAIL